MYPIKLTPAFKDYLWGGTRLRDDFGKDCDYDKVAESWELSCHKDGASVVANGEHAGKTLARTTYAEYLEGLSSAEEAAAAAEAEAPTEEEAAPEAESAPQ